MPCSPKDSKKKEHFWDKKSSRNAGKLELNTKRIPDGSSIRDYPDISYFLLILSGMDCLWEFLYTGTTVGVLSTTMINYS